MLTQQSVSQFARHLQQRAPFIHNIQITTVDGLTLHSNSQVRDGDSVSALTAMLYSAASNLVRCLDGGTPQVMVISMGDYAYMVMPINQDCVMGFSVPIKMNTPDALQIVCDYVQANANQLRITH